MNLISRTITGGGMILIGVLLLVFSFFDNFSFLIYSIPLLIIGFIIFLNKKEDEIEKIKFKEVKK
ncbi:MAG: hypothetical protein ACOC3Z_00885 [Nanoarchaeota archaeon]